MAHQANKSGRRGAIYTAGDDLYNWFVNYCHWQSILPVKDGASYWKDNNKQEDDSGMTVTTAIATT